MSGKVRLIDWFLNELLCLHSLSIRIHDVRAGLVINSYTVNDFTYVKDAGLLNLLTYLGMKVQVTVQGGPSVLLTFQPGPGQPIHRLGVWSKAYPYGLVKDCRITGEETVCQVTIDAEVSETVAGMIFLARHPVYFKHKVCKDGKIDYVKQCNQMVFNLFNPVSDARPYDVVTAEKPIFLIPQTIPVTGKGLKSSFLYGGIVVFPGSSERLHRLGFIRSVFGTTQIDNQFYETIHEFVGRCERYRISADNPIFQDPCAEIIAIVVAEDHHHIGVRLDDWCLQSGNYPGLYPLTAVEAVGRNYLQYDLSLYEFDQPEETVMIGSDE